MSTLGLDGVPAELAGQNAPRHRTSSKILGGGDPEAYSGIDSPVKGRKQIREIGPCGAPFGVIRVHGVAGEGTEMRLASRTSPRHRISDGNSSNYVWSP